MGEQLRFIKILKYTGIVLAALLILLLVILVIFDWNWLKPYLNDRLSDINGRSLVIEGDINVDIGRITRIKLEDLRFDNADWGSDPLMARVEAANIDVKLMPLWDGDIILTRLELKKPWLLLEISEQGLGNWNIFPESDPQTTGDISGTGLPVIDSLIIQDGEIRYRDPFAGTDLKGTAATEPDENGGHRIIIDADGRLLESQLAFCFTGDPLTDLQETGITYQAHMTAEMGQSRGEAEGVIHQPLHFQGMDLKVTLQGPDFSTPAALWDDDFPETPPYRIDTRLILENGVWKLTESTASLGESDFSGPVIIDPADDPLAVTADIDCDVLHVVQLTALFDDPEPKLDTPSETPLDASFLTTLNADIHVRADAVFMPKVPVSSGSIHLLLEDGTLRIDPLALNSADGTVTASATAQPADPGIQGSAIVDFKNIDLSELDLEGETAGVVSGRLVLALPPSRHLDGIRAGLNIGKSRLRYQYPAADIDLAADFQTGQKDGDRRVQADISGEYKGRSLDLSVSGGAVSDLLDPENPVSLSVSGTVNEEAVQLNADVLQQEGAWNLENMDTRLAGSDLTGDIRVDTGGERPEIVADLTSETLDVKRLTTFAKAVSDGGTPLEKVLPEGGPESGDDGKPDAPETSGPIELDMLRQFNADIRIEADRIIAPDIPLENARLDLDLENGQLTVLPLKFDLHGGTVTAGISLNAAAEYLSGTMDADFEQLDLSKILDPFTDLDPDELGVLRGNLDMTLTQADPTALDRDILFPYVGMLKIEESRFSYVNPSKDTDLTLTVQTYPASDRDWPTRIIGDGRYRGEPFDLTFQGDPLLDLREPDDPYSLDLVMEAAATQAKISGEVRRAFDLKGFDITLDMEGPNPARLYPLIGVSLPDLPPYDLKGRLSLNNSVWKFQNFQGRVGDSDLSGNIRIDTAGEKPDMTADLSSEHLDFDDLAGLVGAAPGTGPGETASAVQSRQAAREARDPEVLPEEPYGMERLKAMNAVVAYRAKKVQAPDLPLDELNIDFNLQAGGMLFEPLKFDIGEGSVDMSLSLAPQNGTLQGMVEAEIRRVDLKRVLRQFDIADESAGMIGGRAKYWFQGMSVADLLASADGGAYLLMTGGKLDSLLIELAGLDAGEAVISYFADTEAVQIDCSYADLHARDGVMTLEKFIVDTADTFFSISGTIRFGEETMDLLIHPHPKDISLFTARSPLHITGSFENPEVFPDRSALAARGATALGLGLVAGPAAILPLIETGTTEEPPVCQGIIEFIKEAR